MGQGVVSIPPPPTALQQVLGRPEPFHSGTTRDWDRGGRRRQAAEGNLLWGHSSPSGPGRGGGAEGASAGLKQEARAKPGEVAGVPSALSQGPRGGGVWAGHSVRFLRVRQGKDR